MAGHKKTKAKKVAVAEKKQPKKVVEKSGIPAFVASYIELGKIIGVTRQTLSRWSKIPEAPKPKSDGRHSVLEWRNFMKTNDLFGKSHDFESLRSRDLLAKIEEREFKNSIKRGEYVSVEEVRLAWSSLTAKAMQLLEKALLDEMPPLLAGKEPLAIRIDLEKQMNEVRRILHKGEGLTP